MVSLFLFGQDGGLVAGQGGGGKQEHVVHHNIMFSVFIQFSIN